MARDEKVSAKSVWRNYIVAKPSTPTSTPSGAKRLTGSAKRQAMSSEVEDMLRENEQLKRC